MFKLAQLDTVDRMSIPGYNKDNKKKMRDLPGIALMGITCMDFRLFVEFDCNAIPQLCAVLLILVMLRLLLMTLISTLKAKTMTTV